MLLLHSYLLWDGGQAVQRKLLNLCCARNQELFNLGGVHVLLA